METVDLMLGRGGVVAHLAEEALERSRARRTGKEYDPILSAIQRHRKIAADSIEAASPQPTAFLAPRATPPRPRWVALMA